MQVERRSIKVMLVEDHNLVRAGIRAVIDGQVRLRVRDDGAGFDPASIPERAEPGRAGLGIFGMRERATLLRGTLEIHSAPLKGTEVVAQLPLEDRNAG